MDPESNSKNKGETSFKSSKSNKSKNTSKQDEVVREKDINLEIVGEEDKEEDNSMNVPDQYE